MVKIYSDKTNKFYNSIEEANKAEIEIQEAENREKARKEKEIAEQKAKKEALAANRKAAAERVDKARQAMREAQKVYKNELEKFIKDYGTYHYSTSNFDDVPLLFDFFNRIL